MSDNKPWIYTQSVASVYPHYVAKAEKKGWSKRDVDKIIRWLTGYSQRQLNSRLEAEVDFETFFGKATEPNPHRRLITGRRSHHGSAVQMGSKSMMTAPS